MARFVSVEERYREYSIREEQYSNKLYMAPQSEDQIVFERLGKRVDQKANHYFAESPTQYYYDQHRPTTTASNTTGYKGPYLHATVVAQQQEGRYLQNFAPKGPYVQKSTTIACKGPYLQPVTIVQKAPPAKKNSAPIDCNEAAKIYGGIVFTEWKQKSSHFTLG